MPLDARVVDSSCLNGLSGSYRSFRFSADAVSPLGKADDVALERANSTYSYWQSMCQLAGAELLCLRGPDRFSVASRRGGVVVESEKPMNIGLLRAALKSHMPISATWHAPVDAAAFDPADRVVWALAQRLGRIEAPRCFEILAGEAEYVLMADASGFDIIDQEGGVARLVEKLHEAVQSGAQVEYTFGSLRDTPASSRHPAVSLVAQQLTEGAVHLSTNGWPAAFPSGLPFDALQSLMAVGQMAVRDRLDTIELRDEFGTLALRMSLDNTGQCLSGEIPDRNKN